MNTSNRKFKKGDKVRFVSYRGRYSKAHTNEIITLEEDERDGMVFWTDFNCETGDIMPRWANFCFIELVEPASEEDDDICKIVHNEQLQQYEVITISPEMTPLAIFPYVKGTDFSPRDQQIALRKAQLFRKRIIKGLNNSTKEHSTPHTQQDFSMKAKTKNETVPVLDTEEKLVAYASKFMHRPVTMDQLSFKPETLETVTLIYAGNTEDLGQNVQRMFFSNAFNRVAEYIPTYMGEVDGTAADVILAWRAKQEAK